MSATAAKIAIEVQDPIEFRDIAGGDIGVIHDKVMASLQGLIADRIATRQVGRTLTETLKNLKSQVES